MHFWLLSIVHSNRWDEFWLEPWAIVGQQFCIEKSDGRGSSNVMWRRIGVNTLIEVAYFETIVFYMTLKIQIEISCRRNEVNFLFNKYSTVVEQYANTGSMWQTKQKHVHKQTNKFTCTHTKSYVWLFVFVYTLHTIQKEITQLHGGDCVSYSSDRKYKKDYTDSELYELIINWASYSSDKNTV